MSGVEKQSVMKCVNLIFKYIKHKNRKRTCKEVKHKNNITAEKRT